MLPEVSFAQTTTNSLSFRETSAGWYPSLSPSRPGLTRNSLVAGVPSASNTRASVQAITPDVWSCQATAKPPSENVVTDGFVSASPTSLVTRNSLPAGVPSSR